SAINTAMKRFHQDFLQGRLDVGDFTQLPYNDAEFDLVVDRGALCCCGLSNQQKAINEIYRVLNQNGKFLFTPFSDIHTSSRSGKRGEDGLVNDIEAGTLTGVGQICFLSRRDIDNLFSKEKWDFLKIDHEVITDVLGKEENINSSWNIIVQRK
ncbi:MAG TPA: class I SAM-dependent methyltransferase, partial [Emcibacteraceae bacterium]|nr:class I SAM-dependent methyltransferase [Emcibacteraceae bacterium]